MASPRNHSRVQVLIKFIIVLLTCVFISSPNTYILGGDALYASGGGKTAWTEPNTYKSCPYEGKMNISFRNYCEMYTSCDDGSSRLETCPDGLHFNAAKALCDFPRNLRADNKCEPMDSFAATPASPSKQLVEKILEQNFDCDPVDVIVKRVGKRRCRVQVICANGISFVLRRCMQTISLRI